MCRRLVNLSSILLWIVLQERPFPSHLHHWLILKSVDPRWILRQRQTEEASGGIKSGGVFLAVSSSDSFSTLIWTSTDNIQLLLLKDRQKDEEETWTTRQKRVRQQSKKENVCPSIHSVSPLHISSTSLSLQPLLSQQLHQVINSRSKCKCFVSYSEHLQVWIVGVTKKGHVGDLNLDLTWKLWRTFSWHHFNHWVHPKKLQI